MTPEQYRDLTKRLRDEFADRCGEGLAWEAANAIAVLLKERETIRNSAFEEAAQSVEEAGWYESHPSVGEQVIEDQLHFSSDVIRELKT